jgi:hypothetical protein
MAEQYAQVIARVEPEIKAALDSLKETDGLLLEYQIRMGLLMWLESKGVQPIKLKRSGTARRNTPARSE